MNIVIRNATINDAEKVAKIKIEGWQTSYRGIIDDKFLDDMDINIEVEKRKRNIKDEALIVVAELNNEVVGFCLYRSFNSTPETHPKNADCELTALYVKSSLKGNGIGKKLMQYVMDNLNKQGKKQMILGCFKENYPSRAFYEKMGGKVLKTEKNLIRR